MKITATHQTLLECKDYDLSATLSSGQAFRWRERECGWEAIVAQRWVRLVQTETGLVCKTAVPVPDWQWLANYLQVRVNLADVLSTFPSEPPLDQAREACAGLRLLRQDPWECLASFILSS